MKCPMCLGKGYATDKDIKEYPHRCQNCDGKGFYSVDWQKVRCEVCNGSGKKPQTNEEWLRSAGTDGLTAIFMQFMFDAEFKARFVNGNFITEFRKWLKEIHHDD